MVRKLLRVLKATPLLVRPLRPFAASCAVFVAWLVFVVLLLSWAGELFYAAMHSVARGWQGSLGYLEDTSQWHQPTPTPWEKIVLSHLLRAVTTVLLGIVLWKIRRRKSLRKEDRTAS